MTRREEIVLAWLLDHENEWQSRTDVARGVGLKRTPYLSGILDYLAERGIIERSLGSWRGFSCWYFRTNAERVQTFISIPVDEWIKGARWDATKESE